MSRTGVVCGVAVERFVEIIKGPLKVTGRSEWDMVMCEVSVAPCRSSCSNRQRRDQTTAAGVYRCIIPNVHMFRYFISRGMDLVRRVICAHPCRAGVDTSCSNSGGVVGSSIPVVAWNISIRKTCVSGVEPCRVGNYGPSPVVESWRETFRFPTCYHGIPLILVLLTVVIVSQW